MNKRRTVSESLSLTSMKKGQAVRKKGQGKGQGIRNRNKAAAGERQVARSLSRWIWPYGAGNNFQFSNFGVYLYKRSVFFIRDLSFLLEIVSQLQRT